MLRLKKSRAEEDQVVRMEWSYWLGPSSSLSLSLRRAGSSESLVLPHSIDISWWSSSFVWIIEEWMVDRWSAESVGRCSTENKRHALGLEEPLDRRIIDRVVSQTQEAMQRHRSETEWLAEAPFFRCLCQLICLRPWTCRASFNHTQNKGEVHYGDEHDREEEIEKDIKCIPQRHQITW